MVCHLFFHRHHCNQRCFGSHWVAQHQWCYLHTCLFCGSMGDSILCDGLTSAWKQQKLQNTPQPPAQCYSSLPPLPPLPLVTKTDNPCRDKIHLMDRRSTTTSATFLSPTWCAVAEQGALTAASLAKFHQWVWQHDILLWGLHCLVLLNDLLLGCLHKV